MVNKHTGPGKYFVKVDTAVDVVRAWLYNYDIDGSAPKKEHKDLLSEAVGPVIRDGGNIKLLGLASTTGQAAYDRQLGLSRADGVLEFLHVKFGRQFGVSKEVSFGKEMALAFGQAHLKGGTGDNQESELWRAVVINAWSRALAVPPPPKVDTPFNNSTWADTTGKVFDSLNIALGILDAIADIFELAALAKVTGPLGLGLGVVGSILQLPLLWASTDALANTNGQIQGAADAIQDMADQYKNGSLDLTGLSKWPPVKIPELHGSLNPQPDAFQQAWHAGQIAGRQAALKKVVDLEQNPKPVTLSDGQHIRLSGRLWLRAISKAFGDNAGVEVVVKPANAELAKRGMPPFPTH